MRLYRHAVRALMTMMALAGCDGISVEELSTGGGPISETCSAASPSGVASDIIGRVNSVRADSGRPSLQPNAALSDAAQRHACDMAARGTLSHTGGDGSSVMARIRRAGYTSCYVAENIAYRQPDAPSVMRSWMSSPGHRANILHPQVAVMGVGYATSWDGRPYWVQVFAGNC